LVAKAGVAPWPCALSRGTSTSTDPRRPRECRLAPCKQASAEPPSVLSTLVQSGSQTRLSGDDSFHAEAIAWPGCEQLLLSFLLRTEPGGVDDGCRAEQDLFELGRGPGASPVTLQLACELHPAHRLGTGLDDALQRRPMRIERGAADGIDDGGRPRIRIAARRGSGMRGRPRSRARSSRSSCAPLPLAPHGTPCPPMR
jgi:hypothetical protein